MAGRRFRPPDKTPGGKGIWVISGNDTVVENIEFSGAAVPDANGAGIRFEGVNLTVRNCYFHHNQNGILTRVPIPPSVVRRSAIRSRHDRYRRL
jgi:hypothetical protein